MGTAYVAGHHRRAMYKNGQRSALAFSSSTKTHVVVRIDVGGCRRGATATGAATGAAACVATATLPQRTMCMSAFDYKRAALRPAVTALSSSILFLFWFAVLVSAAFFALSDFSSLVSLRTQPPAALSLTPKVLAMARAHQVLPSSQTNGRYFIVASFVILCLASWHGAAPAGGRASGVPTRQSFNKSHTNFFGALIKETPFSYKCIRALIKETLFLVSPRH